MNHVRLHKEHGVNTAIFQCYICGEDQGLILPGTKTEEFEKAGIADSTGKMNQNVGCIDKTPCPKCQEIMEQGVIFISVKDNDPEYRTGGWCAVKEEAVRRMGIHPSGLLESICRNRVCLIPDTAYDQFGLPRNEEIDNMEV